MKVLLLSRYGAMGASSRVRFLQYLPYLESKGMDITVRPLFSDVYLKHLYQGGSRWKEVLKGYVARVFALLGVWRFDVVVIEKELFPFLPPIFEKILALTGPPYVVDYDDALFHRYDCHSSGLIRLVLGRKIDSVMRNANYVLAGNRYLADRACAAGAPKVEVIPTAVDADRYKKKENIDPQVLTVGWIGTPQTSKYLKPLLPVFESIKQKLSVRFVAVGASAADFEGTVVEPWQWDEKSEVQSIQKFDVGIMPLIDSPWERGKCGYKLIQYMACGLPVVASPVGVNRDIVDHGVTGYLACSLDDWQDSLFSLLKVDTEVRSKMGCLGREVVERRYSTRVLSPKLVKVFEELV